MRMRAISLLSIVCLTGFLWSCKDKGAEQADMMAKNKALIEGAMDMFMKNQVDKVDGIVTADYVDHQLPPGITGTGPKVLKDVMAFYHKAFPSMMSTRNV